MIFVKYKMKKNLMQIFQFRIIYVLMLALCLQFKLLNANTLNANLVFTTQAQINSFASTYPGIDSVLGNVKIGDSLVSNTSINNLNGLSPLKFVGSNCMILNCDALTSVSGLQNITEIGLNCIIHDNNFLNNLNSLNGLNTIGGSLNISSNASIANLNGLSSLSSIGLDGLHITSNTALTSFSGLSALTSVEYLRIGNNFSLINLTGLSTLTYIGRLSVDGNIVMTSLNGLNPNLIINYIDITSNSALTSLAGLENLTHLEGFFIGSNNTLLNLNGLNALSSIGFDGIFIHNNPSLTSLTGLNSILSSDGGIYITQNNVLNSIAALSNIQSIGGGDIYIESNAVLTSLNGINQIDPYSITEISIVGNSNLSTCHVQSVCARIVISTTSVTISGNATGCANKPQVQTLCGTLPYTLNLKMFLQGYFLGNEMMNPVLFNQGITTNSNICDSIKIELRNANFPYSLIASNKTILSITGNAQASFTASPGNYYIRIQHRNGIETWSALPMLFSVVPMNYDFTTAANKAYGNNMIEVESGVWAIYSGDISQDQNIDLVDYSIAESEINNFSSGYNPSDLNGDGNVDLLDLPVLEDNISQFVFSIHP